MNLEHLRRLHQAAAECLGRGDRRGYARALRRILDPAPIRVGIDIDGTLDEHAAFFAALSRNRAFEVVVLTARDRAGAAGDVLEIDRLGLRWDDIVHATDLRDKGDACRRLGIKVLFEDQDEAIAGVPREVFVLKPRNGGNYDFRRRRWLTGDLTRNEDGDRPR